MNKKQKKGDRMNLTPRQHELLRLIRDYQRSHGYSPTMQELADELGVTKVTVFEHIGSLVEKGFLRRLPYRARSLELTRRVEFPDESQGVFPLVGYVAAGAPIEAIENRETLDLEEMFAGDQPRFILKVRGDSMIDEQIRDGDFVVVEKRTRARQGETVVALLENGEATLKKYYQEGQRIRLQPANPNYPPIYIEGADIQIQGVVVGILRKC